LTRTSITFSSRRYRSEFDHHPITNRHVGLAILRRSSNFYFFADEFKINPPLTWDAWPKGTDFAPDRKSAL